MASRSDPSPTPSGPVPKATTSGPQVTCDLCEAPFTLSPEVVKDGTVYGLLVCTQCIEDSINASADDERAEVGLA